MPFDFDEVIDRRCSDSLKWGHYGAEVLPMWVADMDFRSPEPVIMALRERVAHGCFGYGAEIQGLRETILARLEHRYGWRVAPDAVMFMPGVVTAANLACHAFSGPKDPVLLQTPLYGGLLAAPETCGRRRIEASLALRNDGRYELDLSALEAAVVPGTRLFMLCNPHNPVGRVFTRVELETAAEFCLRHDLVICSDEIHCELLFTGSRHIPIATLSPDVARRAITLMAPSKTFNIPGLQLSFAVVEDTELRRRFLAARQGLVCSVGVFGAVAALAAYSGGEPWLRAVLGYLEANRDYLADRVTAGLPGVRMARPEATYLAWLDFRGLRLDAEPADFLLARAKVALGRGIDFGGPGRGFARLNFACPRSVLRVALERIAEALAAPQC